MPLMVYAARDTQWPEAAIDALAAPLEHTIAAPSLDKAFKAHALSLPAESDIARTMAKDVDPDRIHVVRDGLIARVVPDIGPQRILRIEGQADRGE